MIEVLRLLVAIKNEKPNLFETALFLLAYPLTPVSELASLIGIHRSSVYRQIKRLSEYSQEFQTLMAYRQVK